MSLIWTQLWKDQVCVLKEASGLHCWSSWFFFLLTILYNHWPLYWLVLWFPPSPPILTHDPLNPDLWPQPDIFLHTTVAGKYFLFSWNGVVMWWEPQWISPGTSTRLWCSPHSESLPSPFRAEFWLGFDLQQVVFTTSAFSCCHVIGWFSICGSKWFSIVPNKVAGEWTYFHSLNFF